MVLYGDYLNPLNGVHKVEGLCRGYRDLRAKALRV